MHTVSRRPSDRAPARMAELSVLFIKGSAVASEDDPDTD